jgi:hypothetical protein
MASAFEPAVLDATKAIERAVRHVDRRVGVN